ncbi:MAG: hypothetical protein QGG40_16335, partial [Myxococcota bacterium]|nr:hypothetical protein [Myxococcota bacterium]
MQDDQNRTSNQGIGRPRRLANRLREPRTGWILIVMVVATVVFIGLTLWYVANPSWLLRPGTI